MPSNAPVVEPLAGPADLDAVLAIEEATFYNPTSREWYEAELARPEVCSVYVIRTDEASVAGFAAFWCVLDEMHINNLAVDPRWRGRGLGRALLRGVLAAAAARGIRRATLEVRRSNTPALGLYEGQGFTIVGVRPDYYAQPVEDALVLAAAVESPQ
ncbi:MAG: ribosomal protein S18-alanine N-acetyltransferase [Vicinamibacterales bacterium]